MVEYTLDTWNTELLDSCTNTLVTSKIIMLTIELISARHPASRARPVSRCEPSYQPSHYTTADV